MAIDLATSDIALSICIPTYNRAIYLPVLLDSIEREIARLGAPWNRDAVEVVVADNASGDDTPGLIDRYRDRFARLTYVRHPENRGPDRNYLAAVEAASGRFCWLMGSDDKLEDGGLAAVLDATRAWPDSAGLSVNVAQYDGTLTRRAPAFVDPVDLSQDRLVEGAETIFATFCTHFGYLSGQVVRRDLWDAVCATGEPLQYLNAYVHVFTIGRMLQQCPRWGYLHLRCVGYRGGNDSFMGDGWVRRLEIDLVGYTEVADALFGQDSLTAVAVRDRVANRYVYEHYRWAKLRGESRASLARATGLLKTHLRGTPVYRTRLLPWILMPTPAVSGIYRVYRTLFRDRLRAHRLRRQSRGDAG